MSRDPELGEWEKKQGIKSWLSVRLAFGSRTVGFLTIRSPQPNRFETEAKQLAGALANQATLAVEMARLAAKRQQTAILEERNRIAREIYDTLAQSLSGVVVHLEAAQDVLGDAPEECREHIARAADQARRLVWALRPESPQRRNIVDALEGLVSESSIRTETDIAFSSDGEIQSVSPGVEYTLLRVAREALNNAIRHAGPCKLALHLVFEDHHVRLSMADDGCGFVPDEVSGDGFGLIGMRERIERVDGERRIDSRPGAGTRVDVRVPCEG